MEGKSGILVILVILSIVLLVACVAFGVLYAVKQTLIFDDLIVNLYVSVLCGGFFILSSVGIIIARNARITADNTYDILCRVDAVLKEKGLTEADLARRDFKAGEKIAKKEAQLKAKMEAKALKQVLQEDKEARIEASKNSAVEEAMQEDSSNEPYVSPTLDAGAAIAEVAAATTKQANEPIQSPSVDVATSVASISYEEWKSGLDGVVVCGECGGTYSINKTKSGKIVMVCPTARREPNKCTSKTAIPVDVFANKFVAYFKEFFGENISAFDMNLFHKTISKVVVKGGDITFTANEDVL